MGYPITQATTTQPIEFFMSDSADHVTGKTGLSPTVTISKNGGAFASPAGAVTEIGNGWYKIAGNATDNGTLGPLLLYATAAGADPATDLFPVVAYSPQNANSLGLAYLTGDIYARLGAPAGASVSADIATVAGYVDTEVADTRTRVLLALPAIAAGANGGLPTGDGSGRVTLIPADMPLDAAGTRTALGMATANLDTQIAALQADTDNLQTRVPAALVSGRMDSSVGAMAADTLTSSALATSAVTEIQTGISTLDAAGVRSALGMASANLDAQLAAIAGYIDTEIGTLQSTATAIKTKTDFLPSAAAGAAGGVAIVGSLMGLIDGAITALKIASDAITAAKIATDAIGSDELAASAVTKIAAGISVSAPTVQQISTQIERAGGMMESTLIAASAAAGGVSGSGGSGAFAVLGLRTRLSGQESEDYFTVHPGDDKTVAVFFEDASRNYAPCPVVPTAALLDVSGAAVGTATISDSKIEVGYLLVRLQVAGSGNPPATLRLSFAGGSGAAFSHDIPVRAF